MTNTDRGGDESPIAAGDLQPGDVLLYHRDNLLGRVMRAFDNSDVSHVGLYVGDGVAEAIGEGVLERPLAVSLGGEPGDYILVHRLGQGAAAQATEMVVERARAYLTLGLRYGYSTVAMIAFLTLARKIRLTPKARLLLRLILDKAAAELMAPAPGSAQRLICSEFVYRCFREAGSASVQGGGVPVEIVGATVLEGRAGGSVRPLDRESLLERMRDAWDQPELEAARPTQQAEPSPAEIDRAAGDYLAELEATENGRNLESTAPALERAGDDGELLRAMRRFATAVESARNEPALEAKRAGAPPFERFAAIVAKFVSPGDLRRSPTFVRQGRLVLAAKPEAWTDADGRALDDAIDGNRRGEVEALARRMAARLRAADGAGPLPMAGIEGLLKRLRRGRFFAEILGVAGALLERPDISLAARRLYAQALLDTGKVAEGLAFLQALLAAAAQDAREDPEIRGLIGRAHKQRYVDARVTSQADLDEKARAMNAAIDAYFKVYARDRKQYTWHGVNVVALLERAERDGVKVASSERAEALANEILAAIAAKPAPDEWDRATEAEALLARGDLAGALVAISASIASPNIGAFECASTLRQLEQVWQLRDDKPEGALLALLRAALLSREGGKAKIGRGETNLGIGGLQAAVDGADDQNRVLERAFNGAIPYPVAWLQRGLDRARAVGRVEDATGRGVGSGFLVKGGDLFPELRDLADEAVLVTNAHVLGNSEQGALRPDQAFIRFEALGELRRTLSVRELLFESPVKEFDTTIVRLDAAVPGVEPFALAPDTEPTYDAGAPRRIYLLGYPNGDKLSISLEDCQQVGWAEAKYIRYLTPSEPGSSGSAVCDDNWRLLAVHHAALTNANEGVWIHAVRKKAHVPIVVSAGAPVSKATLRNGVFVSYSHEDAKWLTRLTKALAPVTRAQKLTVWSDKNIQPGSLWAREIEKAIGSSSVAVLLVTQAFLASEFITREEIPRIIMASREAGMTLIWVPVSASLFEATFLKDIQAVIDPGRPLDDMDSPKRSKTLVAIAKAINNAADLMGVNNGLSVGNQMALRASGMGGTTERPSDFRVQTKQTETGLALVERDTRKTVAAITAEELGRLPLPQRKLIKTYEKAMRLAYERYLDEYPNQFATEAATRDEATKNITKLEGDVCLNLNRILDFVEQGLGKHLEDHYAHVRDICRQRGASS